MDSDVQSVASEIDLKVVEVATEKFKVKPQTLNRWIREVYRDFGITIGYMQQGGRWLTPHDIDVLRQYQEGTLGQGQNDPSVVSQDDRSVEEVGDQGFVTFSQIADETDRQINQALDVRDSYVADRSLVLAQHFHPDTIAKDILQRAIQTIERGGNDSLGEIVQGGMYRSFHRTTMALPLPSASPKILPGS